jgi:hypothetical protein
MRVAADPVIGDPLADPDEGIGLYVRFDEPVCENSLRVFASRVATLLDIYLL